MNRPRSLTWLRTAALLWLGALGGFAIGVEWIRTRPAPPPPSSGGIDLIGAGATFPYPLYRRWFAEYRDAAGIRINYFSVGSGEGIRLLFQEEADFGATDRPLRPDESALARCGPFELPMVVGPVAVVLNLPSIVSRVRLDAPVLQAIFSGAITRWDDPALRRLNPALAMPSRPIRPVRRARSSGTAEVFEAYLRGATGPTRPALTGETVEGNEGVAAYVRATEGAIGFVELTYAAQSRLTTAALRNDAGAFVEPTAAGAARAAAELLARAGGDSLVALVGARDTAAYPVAGITRLVADEVLRDPVRGAQFVAFARWALTAGSATATALGYAPLPPPESRRQLSRLDALVPGRCPSPSLP